MAAILWPEAAAPFLLGRDEPARQAIAAIVPKGGYLITGALRANPPPAPVDKIWNSIEALDDRGDIVAHYDKAHLVPFGEYVPFRSLLPLTKITAGTMDLSAGPGPRTIALPGLPAFAPLICYEAIFPGAVVDEGDRPAWMLNVTNDAWYGRSSGPYQHFAIARTRAVEEGLPLVRVANNGISAVDRPVGTGSRAHRSRRDRLCRCRAAGLGRAHALCPRRRLDAGGAAASRCAAGGVQATLSRRYRLRLHRVIKG